MGHCPLPERCHLPSLSQVFVPCSSPASHYSHTNLSPLSRPFNTHALHLFVPTPQQTGVDPAKIRIVPEGLDTDLWDPALHKPVNISKLQLQQATGPLAQPTSRTAGKKPFLYLFVGKWEGRKGWKELVQGFCDAFKPTDPVELWVVSKPFLNSGEVRFVCCQLQLQVVCGRGRVLKP